MVKGTRRKGALVALEPGAAHDTSTLTKSISQRRKPILPRQVIAYTRKLIMQAIAQKAGETMYIHMYTGTIYITCVCVCILVTSISYNFYTFPNL